MIASVMNIRRKSCGVKVSGCPAASVSPVAGERRVEHVADGAGGDVPGLGSAAALEQQRGRRLPEVLVLVVAGGQRDLPVRCCEPGDDGGQHVGEVG